MTPLEATVHNQRRAADPSRSAFVMANAGSGKTRVLANRVARLLLEGVAPQKILCITFTKAAAAEMAERLFDMLGGWALADDDKLVKALAELEGDAGKQRNAAALADVRRLFARALETPGGLKTQTIHSFCEQTLKRFPLEAGTPPGFAIIEDAEAHRLIDEAIDAVARAAAEDEILAAAFDRLSVQRNEQDLRSLLHSAAAGKLKFSQMLDRFDGLDGAVAALAAELDIDPETDEEAIRQAFVAGLSTADLQRAHAALEASGGNPAKLAPHIKTFLNTSSPTEQWDALFGLLMTGGGAPRKKITTNATDKIDAWAKPFLTELQEAFVAAHEAAKAAALYADTAAYCRLTAAVIADYAEAKAARAALDFDDLIERTLALFTRADAAWVMYKLDQGIDHILVDEAQDTSPAQWEVIENLFDDFLSGAGARETARSFFAVGDMKQSIYSFQGADAGLFKEKEQELGKRLEAVTDFLSAPLSLSFRTTEPVLSFVDALFIEQEAAQSLGDDVPAHGVKREGEAGLVELWPLTPRPEKPETKPWDAPVDEPAANHPVRVLSEKIAATIKVWLDDGEPLESRGRPIAPGDIMILVQSRGPLFDEIIRLLGLKGVPVAGADRLKLLEDPAVEDLLSFARFAAFNGDDLSLAETLKSPLFGFDDDADLFPLAHGRTTGQTLWAALNQQADDKPAWREAADRLAQARRLGLKEGPYAFLSHILETGAASGRKLFYRRLSQASRDAVDEMLRQALDFESAHPRSLRAFIDWFAANAGEIKREMERSDDAVRVMTVHGAKGLEADIVFLLDAHRGPNVSKLGPVFDLPRDSANAHGRERLCVLAGAAERDVPLTDEARTEKKRRAYEEYRRLLYVAATRARDRLYICGVERGNERNPRDKPTEVKSWHALAEDAFDRLSDRIETGEALWDGAAPIKRLSCAQTAEIEQPETAPAPTEVDTPAWFKTPAAAETPLLRLSPSRLADEEEADAAPTEAPAFSPRYGDKYFRGRTLHRLLELLPALAPEDRPAAADRLLMRLASEVPQAEREKWRDEVLAVLADPDFAPVFAAGSRAEVAIAGAPKGAKPGLLINGQIDRLVVTGAKILVVDYKTNRPPPARIEDVSPAYVAQMAAYRALLEEIYPGREIDCALLWTFESRLTPLPAAMLDHAFARYLAAP